jgi:hypothetical protein
VEAIANIVTVMRFHGMPARMVGWKPYLVPSLRLAVARPLSGAVNCSERPSGNLTLMVTTGAYV